MKSSSSSSVSLKLVKFVLPALAVAWFGGAVTARAQGTDNRAPTVPAALQVPDGNKVSFHAVGIGVQIYRWTVNPSNPAVGSWVFTGPEAILYDLEGNEVGIHYAYAGPTRPAWQSNSGSLVVGARLAAVTVDSTAIPWLLLQAVITQGPGPFDQTTYVQRVNTVGGKAPATPGTADGQVARVDYMADYYFYRADPSAAAAAE
jgi:hypothetical protein